MSGTARNHPLCIGKTLDCVILLPGPTANDRDRKGGPLLTSHGGSRPRTGRPYGYREPLRRVTVALPESSIEQLRSFGDDNPSEGIRRLVEETHTSSGHSWYVLPDWMKDPKASTHPATARRSHP